VSNLERPDKTAHKLSCRFESCPDCKKLNTMEIVIAFLFGAFLMWAIAVRLNTEFMKDLEKLKDFDTWKEWKNQ
jgi:hypothetical protein